MAGEEIVSSRVVTDALDCGEEAGVLDVWCQLRLDPALLAALRKGSSKVTFSNPRSADICINFSEHLDQSSSFIV